MGKGYTSKNDEKNHGRGFSSIGSNSEVTIIENQPYNVKISAYTPVKRLDDIKAIAS